MQLRDVTGILSSRSLLGNVGQVTSNVFFSAAGSETDPAYCDAAGLTMTFNPTFSPGSRDRSSESVTSLISTSTGNSLSPHNTWAPSRLGAGAAGARLGAGGGGGGGGPRRVDRGWELDVGGPITFFNRPHSINGKSENIECIVSVYSMHDRKRLNLTAFSYRL